MAATIDYYFVPISPWAYLGHARFAAIARAAGAAVRVLPVDIGGRVFAASGGLPLAKRAPQRQAYRLVELQRFSEHLGLPLNLHPKYFPAPSDDAARLIIAVALNDGDGAAMKLTGAVLAAVWAEERDIADEGVRAALLAEQGLPAQRLADARGATVQQRFDDTTAQAIAAGVFGAPSYVIDGEIFWGQDRLDFVERRLARA
jgi:2-hydroxychromene-2-carboxylate isomerase